MYNDCLKKAIFKITYGTVSFLSNTGEGSTKIETKVVGQFKVDIDLNAFL